MLGTLYPESIKESILDVLRLASLQKDYA